jgi:hypothetical protein
MGRTGVPRVRAHPRRAPSGAHHPRRQVGTVADAQRRWNRCIVPFASVSPVAVSVALVVMMVVVGALPRMRRAVRQRRLRMVDWDWDRFESEFRAHVDRLRQPD